MIVLPELLSTFDASLLVVTSFVASYITAALGIGGGLLLLSVMVNLIPITYLIPVHGLVQIASNASRAGMLRQFINWRMLALFSLGSVLGFVVAPYVLIQLPLAILEMAVAGFILILQWGPKLKVSSHGPASLVLHGGVITLISSLVGATGPLVASMLAHMPVKQALVATMAAMQTVQHSMKTLVFVQLQVDLLPWLGLVALMVVSGYLGTRFGLKVLLKVPEQRFRFWFRWLITLLALRMLLIGGWSLLA